MSDVHYEHRHTDWGPMEVKLELKGTNVFLEETYAFHISRRGKITVIMASGMGLPDDHDEHIANMVDGHTMD